MDSGVGASTALRISTAVVLNTAELTLSPAILGGAHFSVSPRVGLSAFSPLDDDWSASFGPRSGLALSFGTEGLQLTLLGELIVQVASHPRAASLPQTTPFAGRGQLSLEVVLDAPGSPGTPTSIYVDLGLEMPVFTQAEDSATPIASASIGVVS